MDIETIIHQAKQIDVADLISRYTPLEKTSSHEWQGPCPKCGGTDRLHAKVDGWFCRQCKPIDNIHGWHDAVDFMCWLDGSTFQEATEKLTNQPWPERKTPVNQSKAQRVDDRAATWFQNAATMLHEHQIALSGSEGAAYLRGRGLLPSTWTAFGLGFAPEYPAIAMPWYRGGKITAIRYRLLNPSGKQKIVSLPGSKFAGVLFGSQALPDWVLAPPEGDYRGCEQHCTLVLCEGEINAMSIWQVAHDTNLHVLSMGSESGKLSAGAIEFAKRYGRVIIWMDKHEKVTDAMGQIPDAYGFASPNGKDANDLLQGGTLGGQLVALRWQAAKSEHERQGLFWDLWDAANEGDGLDTSTAMAFKKLCEYWGSEFVFVEGEPDTWFTGARAARRERGEE